MRSVLPLAILAPAAAALVSLLPGRRISRGLWFAAMGAATAAAAAAFWEAYGGDPLVWRGFRAGLLPATLVASLGVGTMLAGARAARLSPASERLALAGLGVGACGAAACALQTGTAALALFIPLPTLGVVVATLAGRKAALPAAGIAGLAVADLAAVAGLWMLTDAADSTLLTLGGVSDGLGAGLLLAAAAVKAGAVPFAGTWAAGDGVPAARLVQVPVRVQGLALAAVAGLTLRPALDDELVAGVAAGLALACGLSALLRDRGLNGIAGVGPAVAGVALGMGGAVGALGFALLAAVLPLLWGLAAMLLAEDDPADPTRPLPQLRPGWGIASAIAAGAALASLALLPPGGGFPGGWLVLSLGVARAPADPTWLILVAAVLAGIAAAAYGAVAAVRGAAATRLAVAGLAVSAASLYAGVLSGRLGLGWLARVGRDLGLASVLPSAGAPALPPFPAIRLSLAATPALLLVGALVLRTRGVRGPGPDAPRRRPRELPPAPLGASPSDQVRFVVVNGVRAARAAMRVGRGWRARGQAWGIALVAEALAVLGASRLVVAAMDRGFL